MTTLDFPVAPLVGDRFPTPSVAGMPQYIWDGEKWTTAANTITTAPPSTATPLEDNATPQIGVTTKYAREDHVHPSTALKYSAQTLTTTQQSQSRINLAAAPFDALAYNGMQINGSMEVSQEKGTGSTSAGHVCDGWILSYTGTMVIWAAISSSAVIPLLYHLGAVTATAQPSLGAGDFAQIVQRIEGWRCARLSWGKTNAQPITIGFWTAHHRTGVYGGVVSNANSSRSYAFAYTQNVADVAQYNTITVPGDTTGVWATDNTTGIVIHFTIACGTTYTAPAVNTWYGANYVGPPGQVNGVAATSDAFRLAGVVVLPGIEAPSSERSPLIMRPYDQELATCRRYYAKMLAGGGFAGGMAVVGTQAVLSLKYPPMRVAPTTGVSGNFTIHVNGGSTVPVTSFTIYGNVENARIDASVASGLTGGHGAVLHGDSVNSAIILDARL